MSQGGGNGHEVFDKQAERHPARQAVQPKREILLQILLQMAKAVTSDAIVNCNEWRVGAPLGASDRVDPPGAI
jgi:hypothetical protein